MAFFSARFYDLYREFWLCTVTLAARFVDRGIVVNIPATATMPSVEGSIDDVSERGRGFAIVQATTDRFEYRRTPEGENIWTIEKYFPGRLISPSSIH